MVDCRYPVIHPQAMWRLHLNHRKGSERLPTIHSPYSYHYCSHSFIE